ncbi:putative cysteine--tRNA ligase [Dissostichus eleginoides]|uniref:Cysteine--tRNA ligase n=1 Tax=Dissostichus eleginoides TaxID=100907 RepID=A0AAD9CLP3_DISEL|nr:putative cysteine--tRNA ligase [Dissostichus eleginoides]
MATTTKSITIGDSKMYDLNVIYWRTIALFFSDRDVDVKEVLAYELAPVPTAMFTEDGMRICKAKSTLKKSLQVEVSRRNGVMQMSLSLMDQHFFGPYTGQLMVLSLILLIMLKHG